MHSNAPVDAVCATARLLPFTRQQILAAFADGRRLAAWWGPDGFSNSFELFEFRPGGRWKFLMQGPDGKTYPNESRFLAIDLDRIVIEHLSQPCFTLTVSLAEQAQGTVLAWHQAFDDPRVAAGVRHIVEPANEQNLDRLHRELMLPATD